MKIFINFIKENKYILFFNIGRGMQKWKRLDFTKGKKLVKVYKVIIYP